MKKVLLLIILLFPFNVFATSLPNLYSKNFLVYDRTNKQILHEKNSQVELPIASLTKIMTTITAIEKIEDLDAKVIVTSEMLSKIDWDASLAGLKVNDEVTYLDLLYASMLPSGADATQCLAYSLSGSIENYVSDMNTFAKELGMNNTNFVNVTGLDIDNHYSSLMDVLKLLDYALNNELFRTVYTTKEYTLTNGLHVKTTLYTYNSSMNLDVSRIIGSKTGFTDNAGRCISFLFNSNDHEFVAITTGAPYAYRNSYNLRDALSIIDFIDNNYKEQTLFSKENIIKEIPIKLSKQEIYQVKNNLEVTKFLPNDYNQELFKVEYTGLDTLDYNNSKNSKIGKIKYYYNDEELAYEDVILNMQIEMDLNKVLYKNRFYILGEAIILVLVVIIFIIYIKRKKNQKRRKKRNVLIIS